MSKLYNVIKILLFLGVLFIVINLGVFFWFLINPNGFWGVFWFHTIFSGLLFLLIQAILILVITKKQFNSIGIGILLSIFLLISFSIEFAPSIYITKKLYDKYRYVNRTEKYFNQGRFEKALKYATKLNSKNSNDLTSPVWFMRSLFLQTERGEKFLKNRQYQSKLNYAFCLSSLGREIDLSEKLFIECEELSKIYFKDQIEYYLVPLIGRSRVHLYKGEIIKAEQINNKVLSNANILKEKDFFWAMNYMFWHALQIELYGNMSKAQLIRKSALNLYDKSENKKTSTLYFTILLSVIKDNLNNGLIKESVDLVKKADRIAKDKKDKLIYLDYINLKAYYYELKGEYEEAENFYRKLVSLSKRKSYPEYSSQLSTLGAYLFRQKRYDDALKSFTKSFEVISERNKNQGMSLTQSQIIGIILSNYALGNKEIAINQSYYLDSLIKESINQYFMILSSDEKETFAVKVQKNFEISNSIFIAQKNKSFNGIIYNNVLATKNIALTSNIYFENFLKNHGTIGLTEQLSSIMNKKKNLENLKLIQTQIDDSLQNKIDSLILEERVFIENISELQDFKPFNVNKITWDKVKTSLQDDEIAIEFINCPEDPIEQEDNKYYALIIDSSMDIPELIPLFKENELLKILSIAGSTKERINQIYSDSITHLLYKKIWQPLLPYIIDKKNINISLSGILHQVSFSAITISEPYTVNILSSTRVITSEGFRRQKSQNMMVLFGDVDYKYLAGIDTNFNTREDDLVGLSLYRDINFRIHQKLPGTREEVDQISSLLNAKGINYKIYSEENASEESFRNISLTNPDIIHLATHGFYYPEKSSVLMKNKLFNIENDYNTIHNPMFRSGLLFSGANSNKNISLLNDGIIISNDIIGMDLSDVDLVVLSACETGLGDIYGSEGVFGLQRAFKLAGANKLVMSLWKVPDKETSILMTKFYEFYLSGSQIHDALKKAQLEVRKTYPDPFYWAGFFALE